MAPVPQLTSRTESEAMTGPQPVFRDGADTATPPRAAGRRSKRGVRPWPIGRDVPGDEGPPPYEVLTALRAADTIES
jgi:hypothetical protein